MQFTKHSVFYIFYSSFILISGEWYSASVIENGIARFVPKNGYFAPQILPIENGNVPKNTRSEINEKNEWTPSIVSEPVFPNLHKETGQSNKTSPFETVSGRKNININNTITIENTVKTVRPKRRIVRRKCPVTKRKQRKPKQNKSRFLEVFEVVEFDHVSCTSSSGLEGTCLPEYDCQGVGGSTMGSCADGYGTCCVIEFKCDARSSAAAGWFTNPGFPSPSTERLSCTLTLDKASEDIKQIRLDFLSFEILPPTAGTCEQDQFVISGQNVNNRIPILCGINTGQHVYIEVGNVDGPFLFSIQTIAEETRLFAVKMSQLTATDDLAAPTGCLQYFKEPQGYLESFNYRDQSEVTIARTPGYLNNLNYAICIEREPNSCSITYTNSGDMQLVNYDTDGLPVIPPRQAGVEIFNCPSDWLLISAVRLCGERLNDGSVLQDFSIDAPVTDDGAGPLTIWFRTDSVYSGRGFKLFYQQNTCSTNSY